MEDDFTTGGTADPYPKGEVVERMYGNPKFIFNSELFDYSEAGLLEVLILELRKLRQAIHWMRTHDQHVDEDGCNCRYHRDETTSEAWECPLHERVERDEEG